MTTQTNFDFAAAQKSFLNNLGNGANALMHFDSIMQNVVADGNTNRIGELLVKVEAKKDNVAAGMVRFIVGQVFKGAKMVRDKKRGTIVIKTAGIKADKDIVGRISAAVADKQSIRSSTLRKFILEGNTVVEVDKPKLTSEQAQERVAKYLAKIAADSGLSLATIQAMATAKPTKKAA